jgi:hypothetical protein
VGVDIGYLADTVADMLVIMFEGYGSLAICHVIVWIIPALNTQSQNMSDMHYPTYFEII